jgi:protein tyrosine phosphatase
MSKQIEENLEIFFEKEETIINKCLVQRDFIIRYGGKEKRVTQMQMINWQDHSAPDIENGGKTIEYLMNAVNDVKSNSMSCSPVLVHCSAGTGRTGAFIAIYNIIRSLTIIKYVNSTSEIKIKPFFSVFNTVRKLREQRMLMVTSLVQYKFIYDMVIDWTKKNMETCELC